MRRLLIPAVALALLLGACAPPAQNLPADAGDSGAVDPGAGDSGTDDSGDTAPESVDIASIDACAVLTADDAATLIARDLTEPVGIATSDVSSCTYTADPNGPVGQVEIYIGPGAQKQFDLDKDVLEHVFTQPAGVGDEAWQEDYMIFARTGETWVSIRIVILDDPGPYVEPLQAAMTAALARL
jgi:hypothetical protein